MKKLLYIFMALLFSANLLAQNWDYKGAFPDTNYSGGSHGIVVTPDGNIWTASYYHSVWVTPDGDTLTNVSPIYVFKPDGTPVDTIGIVMSNLIADTLGLGGGSSGCRGLAVDNEGNVIYVSSAPNRMIKINYQTREGMYRSELSEIGSSPTAPSVAADGTIFVGPVVGGGTSAIAMYKPDLSFLANAVVAPPAIARTLEVSSDGNTIYWMPFTSDPLQIFVYTRNSEFEDFALTDSVLQGMSIESSAWNPSTGLLWVSNDSRGTGPYTHLTWYGYDATTKTVVDSFTLPSPSAEPSDEYPRALDFSSNGNVAYVGLFGTKYARAYKFEKATGVAKELNTVVKDYELSQNYPNPFNPTTNIKFSVAKEGMVSLVVYDILGRKVATLVNEWMSNGKYTVDFNASNLSSGTYIYQLNVNGMRISKKMTLLK